MRDFQSVPPSSGTDTSSTNTATIDRDIRQRKLRLLLVGSSTDSNIITLLTNLWNTFFAGIAFDTELIVPPALPEYSFLCPHDSIPRSLHDIQILHYS